MRFAICDLRLAAVVSLAVLVGSLRAAEQEELPPNLETSIGKGLAFLARQQNADGSFATEGPKLAISGLSVLAFLSAGDTPDVGKYGLVVRNAEEYLLSQTPADGYFGAGSDRGMYIHAIVTLALAEAYGVETRTDQRQRMRSALKKAVAVILAAQNAPKAEPKYVGGWRYDPKAPDADLSLSGWNALALRAAQDVGIEVPRDAAQKAADFVLRCYHDDAKAFSYQPGTDVMAGDTAVAVLCLYVLGAFDRAAQQIEGGCKFLADHPPDDQSPFPCYCTYYVAHAAFQRGGETWDKLSKQVFERLLKQQDEKDGGWPQSREQQEPGRVYATAMAVQTLAIPYRLLPVYQR